MPWVQTVWSAPFGCIQAGCFAGRQYSDVDVEFRCLNALVNLGSSGYRCRSRRTFGCLFGTIGAGVPLVRSGVVVLLRLAWVVTELAYRGPRLLAVVGHVC